MKNKLAIVTLAFTLLFTASFAQTKLATGIWRGALKTASGTEIPFNFEVSNVAGKQHLAIINGAERFKVDNLTGQGDSVFIKMPLFDSEFRLKLQGGNLTGCWVRHLGDKDANIDFKATPNTAWRFFKTPQKPTVNVTGRWSAIIDNDVTVGEFKQTGNKLTGTFLSTTGDYRYLDGVVSGNQLYLSCFDGGHAYTFTAKINGQKMTDGKFYAGYTSIYNWAATKDENAKLLDAYSLTALKPGYKKIDFSFRDISGNKVSLSDDRFKNKVVIVQIMGSWCPNCMDETDYLVNYYKKYHPKGVEIVGLAYERTTDFAKSQKTLAQLKARFNVPYPLLITGYTNASGEPAKSLPMLAKVLGFPTTIIIDKKGDVRKIHTGFSGPGTGNYYTEFKTEFEGLTNNLLAER
ncbi:MAG TPA: TlpA disulfide reductase family protein [Mucilaginibacter sp.]